MAPAGQSALPMRYWLLVGLLVAFVLLLLLPAPGGMGGAAWSAAAVAVLMALLWVTEAIPLAATALVPLALFPILGIAGLEVTARSYAQPLIFLFMGGFMLAAAMERWRLHRRLALAAISLSGRKPRTLVLAMMCVTAFLSLWVSNTATAMVMVPIAASLVARPPEAVEGSDPFGAALLLGIAFSATIGGMGSLIGTPPNALLAGYVQQTYGITIGFGQWMLIGLPIVIILLPITWLLLTRVVVPLPNEELPEDLIPATQPPMSTPERTVALVLVLTALAWIVRPWLAGFPGLSALSDAGIAVTAALVLFLLPARRHGSEALLDWNDVKNIRWDVLILFGGGLALAGAIGQTGLADWIGGRIGAARHLPVALVILVMMATIVYLGELASNTAVAAVFLPAAGAAAVGLGVAPLALLLPVALAASLGFMLPVATPPNAIVYGTGNVSARQMLKAGAALDVISIAVVYVAALLLGPKVLG